MTTYSMSREAESLHSDPHGECAPRGMTFLRRRGRVGSPPAAALHCCR
ncbi:hypothetical protein [Streptomyces albofaciens]|nr:hypothetical protein [Streptomyces albofaciens]